MSWHATPFEERLEKALSEESIVTRYAYSLSCCLPCFCSSLMVLMDLIPQVECIRIELLGN